MKTFGIFYTDKKFRDFESIKIEELKLFDQIIPYKREWLEETKFYLENKEILDMLRGGGYWLWKPYIIQETLKKMEYNDVLLYIDAGDKIELNDLSIIDNHMKYNDYIITNFNENRKHNYFYTKRDCFILMNCDEVKYYNVRQIEAGVLVFKKTPKIEEFINEWLFYCKNKNILTDISNEYGENIDGFIDHRHDQSILCNLTVKYNMNYSNVLLPHIHYNYYIASKL